MSTNENRFMTDERVMIREVAREFTMKEVLPIANKLDPVRGEIPASLREKLAEMGYFGIRIPEEYGGSGLGCFEYCLIAYSLFVCSCRVVLELVYMLLVMSGNEWLSIPIFIMWI